VDSWVWTTCFCRPQLRQWACSMQPTATGGDRLALQGNIVCYAVAEDIPQGELLVLYRDMS
jgi:hypothetical protein